jgi:hypothetical protein
MLVWCLVGGAAVWTAGAAALGFVLGRVVAEAENIDTHRGRATAPVPDSVASS